jgi:hypothetical protein
MLRDTHNERQLRYGNEYTLSDISRIKSLCRVEQPGAIKGDFIASSHVTQCQECTEKKEKLEAARNFVRRLRTLSVFGGAGGLDIGLSFSHCRTNWMIDMCQRSCETFRLHHPSTVVIQKEAGLALEDGEGLPVPGEVDMIVMGPPCQSFSKMVSPFVFEREYDRYPNLSHSTL